MANSNMQMIGELVDGRTLSWSPEDEAYFAWIPERAEHVKVHLVDDEISPATGTAELLGTSDPQVWAKAFVEQFDGDRVLAGSLDVLIGWFANAMQAKETELEKRRDEADQDQDDPDAPDEITRLRGEARGRPHRFSTSELHELAFQIGGAAALPLLKSTGAVMPAEEVAREVNMILESFDLPTLEQRTAYHVLDPDDENPDSVATAARARLRAAGVDAEPPLAFATGMIKGPDGGLTINITLNAPHS